MTQYVNLPLSNVIDYKYTVALEGDYYTIRYTYNETMKLYTMTIYDVNGVTLVAGVGLVPNFPVALDYIISGLSGGFFLVPKADTNTEFYKQYPQNLADYYTLSYIYDSAN